MPKLYPPNIEGTLPAFYTLHADEERDKWVTYLVVPFSMNKAVVKSEVAGIQLKLKTVQSGKVLFTKEIRVNSEETEIKFDPQGEAIFDISEWINNDAPKLSPDLCE